MHRPAVTLMVLATLTSACDLPSGPEEARDRLSRGEERVIQLELPFPRMTIHVRDEIERFVRPFLSEVETDAGAAGIDPVAAESLRSNAPTVQAAVPELPDYEAWIDELPERGEPVPFGPDDLPGWITFEHEAVTIELVTHDYIDVSRAAGDVVGDLGEALLSGGFRLGVTNESPLGYVVSLALAPTPRDTAGFNPFRTGNNFVMSGIDIPAAEVAANGRVTEPASVTNSVSVPTEDLGVFRAGRLSLGLRLRIVPPRSLPDFEDPDRLDYSIIIEPLALLELLARAPTEGG